MSMETNEWQAERVEAIAVLRSLCKDFNLNNSWPDELHLADIIEKYIRKSLEAQEHEN